MIFFSHLLVNLFASPQKKFSTPRTTKEANMRRPCYRGFVTNKRVKWNSQYGGYTPSFSYWFQPDPKFMIVEEEGWTNHVNVEHGLAYCAWHNGHAVGGDGNKGSRKAVKKMKGSTKKNQSIMFKEDH